MDLRVYFIVPYVISAAAIFATGPYTHLRRDSTGAIYLSWSLFGAGWWPLTEGLLYLGASPESNIIITKVQYLGFTFVCPLYFLETGSKSFAKVLQVAQKAAASNSNVLFSGE